MDPKHVKLTLRQKIGPLKSAMGQCQELVISSVLVILGLLLISYMTYLFPVLIAKSAMFDIILRFMLSTVILVVMIAAIQAAYQVYQDDIRSDVVRFKEIYEEKSLEIKKEVLENAETEMLK